jgi:hypothetical protein
MPRIYSINIRWISTAHTDANIQKMDLAIGQAGDWLRFNGFTWLVWTNANANQLNDLVRKVASHLDDSVLVIAVDPSDFNGWAPQWVWEWINSKRPAATLGDILGGLGGGMPPPKF